MSSSAMLLRRVVVIARASSSAVMGRIVVGGGGGGGGGGRAVETTTASSPRRTMTTIGPTGGPSSDHERFISEELYPEEETEGEWVGCYLKFLPPISTYSRGIGKRF